MFVVSKFIYLNILTGELSTFALIMTNHVSVVISTICFLWLEYFINQNFRTGDPTEIKRHFLRFVRTAAQKTQIQEAFQEAELLMGEAYKGKINA